MSTSASQDSSSMNTEKSTAGTEWILSNPVIDNPIYDFFEKPLPHRIPIFDTEDHTYTYLMDSSCLTRPIKHSAPTITPIPTGAQNEKTENPSKHNLDVATPPLSEDSTGVHARLSQNDKRESPTKHDLDAATPPLPEGSNGVNVGLSQNNKIESPRKHDLDAATPPPVAATQPKELIHYVAAQHVIVVQTGEDVADKIFSFAKSGPKSVTIKSATGKLATVVLKKTSTSREMTIHEGLFDIVSLSGFFMRDEVEGRNCWTGTDLHLSLTADGIALEGCVAGELTAASPVEVTVRSVTEEGKEDSQ